MKFAGLFVERVPVDESGNPLPKGPLPGSASAGQSLPQQPAQQTPMASPAGNPHATAALPQGSQPLHGVPLVPNHASQTAHTSSVQPLSVALRAWVPQEYAAHLAPHGIHVIAAGGSITSEQARGWGADALIVSAECLGQDVGLLQQPQLPTVFITPQPVMIPDIPGVIQVQEPLRASDVTQATRDAVAHFAAARAQ